jgi:hypothetical protein
VQSGAELGTLQTRRDLQDDPLARAGLLLRFLEGYAVFMPGSAGLSAAISTSFEISSVPREPAPSLSTVPNRA